MRGLVFLATYFGAFDFSHALILSASSGESTWLYCNKAPHVCRLASTEKRIQWRNPSVMLKRRFGASSEANKGHRRTVA